MRFGGAQEAVGRLFALAQALANDYERFEALVGGGEAVGGKEREVTGMSEEVALVERPPFRATASRCICRCRYAASRRESCRREQCAISHDFRRRSIITTARATSPPAVARARRAHSQSPAHALTRRRKASTGSGHCR